MTRTAVFYISGHGFGHASRDIEVINAMLARREDVRVLARTSAARWLFEKTIRTRGARRGGLDCGPGFDLHAGEVDTGVVQIDSLRLDEGETIRRARAFMRTIEGRIDTEVAFLHTHEAAIVVSDIPPLGIAAALRAGVPAVALGNFTWDWIYAGYADAADIAREIADIYRLADSALRLPMHGGFDVFRQIIDIPLIARRSTRDPAETRRTLGLPEAERLVLVSFGGYGLNGLDFDALSRLEGCMALVGSSLPLGELPAALRHGRRGSVLPFDEHAMYRAGIRYEDLVRAVDVVVTKPGFGIIAECIANDTALLYTSRGRFVEYDVLVREMPRFIRAQYINREDLFAGRWAPHLEALFAQPSPPERPRVDGADVAAELLLDMI